MIEPKHDVIICPQCAYCDDNKSFIQQSKRLEIRDNRRSLPVEVRAYIDCYIELFLPAKVAMSINREYRLMNEIIELVSTVPTPYKRESWTLTAWDWMQGMRRMVDQHDVGELKTPMKSHNYLKQSAIYAHQYRYRNAAKEIDLAQQQNHAATRNTTQVHTKTMAKIADVLIEKSVLHDVPIAEMPRLRKKVIDDWFAKGGKEKFMPPKIAIDQLAQKFYAKELNNDNS